MLIEPRTCINLQEAETFKLCNYCGNWADNGALQVGREGLSANHQSAVRNKKIDITSF
jgi:hypothetical protein